MRSLHTPQTETNSAYNPGVSYRGGEFMAQGISQAGNAITAGLAQFAKNREERDYMDERMKSVAAELGKYRDFEKSASEDDTSPAGTLLKTFSNWDNKPLAAKKAALVDADHLITKSERNLEQARAEQYQMLAVQDRQAQFDEQKAQNRIGNDRNWKLDSFAALDRHQQNMRGLEADRRADAHLSLAEKGYADTQARYAAGQQEKQAIEKDVAGFWNYVSPRVTAPAGMGPSLPLDMAAIEGLSQFPRTRQDPNLDNLLRSLGGMQPKPAWSPSVQVVDGVRFGTTSPSSAQVLQGEPGEKPLPPVVVTVPGSTPGSSTRVPMTAAQYTAYQAANPPPAELKKRGDRAALEEELRQHETALKTGNDDRYGFANAYSRQNRVVELKRKLAELGGAAPAASAPSRGQALRYKLVNGQLVQE